MAGISEPNSAFTYILAPSWIFSYLLSAEYVPLSVPLEHYCHFDSHQGPQGNLAIYFTESSLKILSRVSQLLLRQFDIIVSSREKQLIFARPVQAIELGPCQVYREFGKVVEAADKTGLQ